MRNFVKFVIVTLGVTAGAYTSYAAGTIAGTSITNQASVSFSVGGTPQSAVNSNTTSFVVDQLTTFAVVSNGNTNVVPSATAQVLSYTLTNTGNYTGDWSAAAVNDTGDNFDPSSSSVFIESGATPGYQSGQDTATYVDELADGASVVIYVVSTIPGSPTNGQSSVVHLQATARAGGVAATQGAVLTQTAGAETPGSIDFVFNDAAGSATGDVSRDGRHSAAGTYNVVTAAVSVTKSSAIISDPVNSTTNPKRIPGAVIEYTISIQNTGAAQADNLSISDTLNANTTYSPGTLVVDGVAEDDNSAGGDETDPNGASFGAGVVSATILALPAAATKTVVFRVTVN